MARPDRAGFAPAKVNLTLHLAGRRADGYHLLNSLVVFAGVGDTVSVEPADELSLSIGGPFATGLSTADNLVLRAAHRLAERRGIGSGAAIHLDKHLPVASGIGGGSSDAAAALRVLSGLWGVDVPHDLPVTLGADVPVCLAAPAPQIMRGIGDELHPVPALPDCWLVLVNPGVPVETRAVFAGVADPDPPPGPDLPDTGFAEFTALRGWLAQQRNDLQAPAIALCPAIAEVSVRTVRRSHRAHVGIRGDLLRACARRGCGNGTSDPAGEALTLVGRCRTAAAARPIPGSGAPAIHGAAP